MALVLSPLVALAAQQTPSRAPSGRPVVACTGQAIDDIIVYADAPTVASMSRVPPLASVVRALHTTTRTELIERFLLLERGEPCTELRRAESERILRAQPFIADADLFLVTNEAGGTDLEVRTSDEASFVIGGNVRARAPNVTSALLGNANLGGQGLYATVAWHHGETFRDAVGMRLIDHQFLGQPWIARLEGERASLGGSWRVESAHPFLTDLQRIAWRVGTGRSTGYAELRGQAGERLAVALDRGFFDVGAILRVGLPGRLTLFGLSVTGIDEQPGSRLVRAESGSVRDVGPLPRAYTTHKVGRINALIGKRRIRFVRLDGLDALTAAEDVPVGFQVGTLVGRSIPVSGATEEDVFVGGDLYAGATNGTSTVRLQLQGEGRRGTRLKVWDGVLTTGRLTHYLRISPRNQNQLTLEWSGVSRQRTPFQLVLGVPDGGVRGYEQSSLAGGQRLVLRTEERFTAGTVLGAADAGVAGFADVGRQWAGDVPFGVTTPVKASLGISLLAAVPRRSARLWRLDLAVPVTSGAGSRWTLRFSNSDRTAFAFRTPRDVEAGREMTVPSSIFAWP